MQHSIRGVMQKQTNENDAAHTYQEQHIQEMHFFVRDDLNPLDARVRSELLWIMFPEERTVRRKKKPMFFPSMSVLLGCFQPNRSGILTLSNGNGITVSQ